MVEVFRESTDSLALVGVALSTFGLREQKYFRCSGPFGRRCRVHTSGTQLCSSEFKVARALPYSTVLTQFKAVTIQILQ